MRKLLRQPAARVNNHEHAESAGNAEQLKLRPSASQDSTYSAGAPLTCLDRSPDGKRAVIAGAKTFKILKVDGATVTEDVDLRALITSYAAFHDASAATPDQLNIRTVQWSHGTLDSTIITASGNGRITVYDLNRPGEGLEVARIQEHARQVHKLAINPNRNTWLLSASQDGTVKSFDLRSPIQTRQGSIFKSIQTYKCNADAVRDVKWSTNNGHEFACCTDSGLVLKWDWRQPTAPLLRIAAHPSSCSSISWHPDGKHLMSGGIDLHCKVWDMSGDRNQKAKFDVSTPAPISRVSWRPGCWSATAQGNRAAQVAVSYDDTNAQRSQNATVDILDMARPAFPFKEIEHWDTAPTEILWNSRDLLWSVDKAGRFIQTDVAFVPQMIDRRSLSTFAFSETGDVLMVLEERNSGRRKPPVTSPESSKSPPSFQRGSGPLLSVSRSDSEEDVVGSFLGPRRPKGNRRRSSGRSVHSVSTTPPHPVGSLDKVMPLEEGVKITGPYKPQQVIAIGHAPSTAKRSTYRYFSNRYLQRLSKDPHVPFPAEPMNSRMSCIMESFARSAEDVGSFRLAQSWRLLGFTINILLTRRAEHHRAGRMKAMEHMRDGVDDHEDLSGAESRPETAKGQETPRRLPSARNMLQSALQSPPFYVPHHSVSEEPESTSNVATPLVRPVNDRIDLERRGSMHTPMLPDNDDLRLPDPLHVAAPIRVPGAKKTSSETGSSIDGYDFYGMENFSPSPEQVAPARKQSLRLDSSHTSPSQQPLRIEPKRHASSESFQMFSSSVDSQQSETMGSSSSDNQGNQRVYGRSLREQVSSWENNFGGNRKHRASIGSEAATMSDVSQTPSSAYEGSLSKKDMPPNASSPPKARRVSPVVRVKTATPLTIRHHDEPMSPTFLEKHSEDPNIIETDFLPWPADPSFIISPIDPAVLVQRSIDFEVQTGVLNAATIVLLLRPLLPKGAVDEIQAGAILRQYHHRLQGMQLHTEAALLRNLCVPLYPAVFATSQERVTIGFYCTSCHRPLENDPLLPGSVWTCPRCKDDIAPCPVCLNHELKSDMDYDADLRDGEEYLSLWWLCPGCGHGGHAACMQAWHAPGSTSDDGDAHSGGCCPLEGCLHPCLPGSWCEEKDEEKKTARAREMDREVKRRSSTRSLGAVGGVRRDARDVNQSRAVEGARVALNLGAGLERRKSVKLVAPGEEM